MDVLGVAPWVVISGGVAWLGQLWLYRDQRQQRLDDRRSEINKHRDGLAVELLKSSRSEIVAARAEMEELRQEITTLRALEQHFYHFQQALEHLDLVLSATPDEFVACCRNARAFLMRMKRLQEAKGTIANEAQRVDSVIERVDRDLP